MPGNRSLASVYEELRRLARRYLSHERGGHTLQPTALVHETYLRLLEQDAIDWENGPQVVGVAARLMRRILVDHARARTTQKRSTAAKPVQIVGLNQNQMLQWLDLGRALEKLEEIDPDLVRVVELKFFGGFSIDETAALMQVGSATVKRHWSLARSWLYRELGN
ncbi:MAG: ECF-type sigma factor [Acidobacteriota bacterium]|nr:ECF-type sigma factor [Acidobacteriota bacterium]